MDTEGVLKLDKCPECGLLFPVGTEHVCEGPRPISDAERKKRNLVIAVIAVAAVIVIVGSQAVMTFREQRGSTVATVSPAVQQERREARFRILRYNEELQPYLSEWDDAVAVANSTAAIALSLPISDLQRVRRNVTAMTAPPETYANHAQLITAMGLTIDAYIGFMGQEPEPVVASRFQRAKAAFAEWTQGQ